MACTTSRTASTAATRRSRSACSAPTPGRGQVIVRVRAVSLNFRELMIVEKGVYPLPIKPDLIPASDGAGEVVAVGEGVTRVKVGDRVVGQIFTQWIDGPFGWGHA